MRNSFISTYLLAAIFLTSATAFAKGPDQSGPPTDFDRDEWLHGEVLSELDCTKLPEFRDRALTWQNVYVQFRDEDQPLEWAFGAYRNNSGPVNVFNDGNNKSCYAVRYDELDGVYKFETHALYLYGTPDEGYSYSVTILPEKRKR